MKKLIFLMLITVLIVSLCGCKNSTDTIDIHNKSTMVFDNVMISIKAGYYYDKHEKFTVDEDTVGVTIYFSKENDGEWESKGGTE